MSASKQPMTLRTSERVKVSTAKDVNFVAPLRILALLFFLIPIPIFFVYQVLSNSMHTRAYASVVKRYFASNQSVKAEGSNNLRIRKGLDLPTREGRVAICLAGGLRRFELTGPTLQPNLFSAYENSDIFVTTPLDSNAHKLWMLTGSNVVAVHYINPLPFPEDEFLVKVIHPEASAFGRQGLMHYSALVERCGHLIQLYEVKHGFRYDWIVRTRPDGLWRDPPPPVQQLSKKLVYVPRGSSFGFGLNDRMYIAQRDIALQIMSWVSSIPEFYKDKKFNMVAEDKHLEFLKRLNLGDKIMRSKFYFCVLSEKSFPYPPKWNIGSTYVTFSPIDAPLDGGGRYCRPCLPLPMPITEESAYEIFNTIKICNSSDTSFRKDWRQNYDSLFGSAIALKRTAFESKNNFWSCVQMLEKFSLGVEIWEGEKDVYKICAKGFRSE